MKTFLLWLFPNGIGTRAVLSFIVVGAAVIQLTAGEAKEALFLVLAFYFMDKRNNGALPQGGNK